MIQCSWNPNEGEAVATYVHAQTKAGSGLGKIGSLIGLKRADGTEGSALTQYCSQLAMHNAAMKAAYVK